MLTDLARSGLTPADAKRMKLRPVTADEMGKISEGNLYLPAYEIPILGINGEVCGRRYRILPPPNDDPQKFRRYYQPAGRPNLLYFPPFLRNGTTWPEVIADPKALITITEGEKKAAAACKAKLPAIAITGVWNWVFSVKGKNGKDDLARALRAIKDLSLINWKGREVLLIFDSDVVEKLSVEQALHALAGELLKRGARPWQILLPPGPNGEKVGIDDWLVKNKFNAKALLNLPHSDFAGARKLWDLNQRYGYLYDPPGHVVRINDDDAADLVTLMRPRDFQVELARLKPESAGEVSLFKQMGQPQAVASSWLEWPHRTEYARLSYEPGQPQVMPDGALNVWPGWGAVATRGDVSPFLDLINHLLKDVPANERRWFLQWLAYPIQNPGRKMFGAVLIIGPPGSGKNLLGAVMGTVYGKNYCVIEGKNLHDNFNSVLKARQFVFADEVFSADRRREINAFKTMITRSEIYINEKFVRGYYVRDCINWLFASNDFDPIYLQDDDRRFFVLTLPKGSVIDPKFGSRVFDWAQTEAGAAAVHHYLLHEVNCVGFEWNAPPPVTEAKLNVIELSKTNADRWARDLIENPPKDLWPFARLFHDGSYFKKPPESDLFELDALVKDYDYRYRPGAAEPSQPRTVQNALAKAGAVSIAKVIRLHDKNKARVRVWAIKNTERWRRAGYDEVARYLNQYLPVLSETPQQQARARAKKKVTNIKDVRAARLGRKD
jgi:hypothetical protein